MQRSLLCALLWAASLAAATPAFAWTTTPALNPDNGHYYAFFNGADDERLSRPAMPFADALTRAASMSHLGIDGHLATITSQAEQDFVREYFLQFTRPPSNPRLRGRELFWIAASDAAVEGEWRWVAGPEEGEVFWQGSVDWRGNITGQSFGYNNWTLFEGLLAEPNNHPMSLFRNPEGEDYVALNLNADQFYLNSWWNDVIGSDDRQDFSPRLGLVEFSPVPEPASATLIVSAAVAFVVAIRRRG